MNVRARLLPLFVCLVLGAIGVRRPGARTFHPRVEERARADPAGQQPGRTFNPDRSRAARSTPVTYHGGSVMAGGVTVHTIFWAPAASTRSRARRGQAVPDLRGH